MAKAQARKRAPTKKTTKKRAAKEKPTGIVVDPRQALCLKYFFDRDSGTFGSVRGSAIKAGFDVEYADQLSARGPKWLTNALGKVRTDDLLAKAERNLNDILDMPTRVQAMSAFGPVFQKKETYITKRLKNGTTKKVKSVEKIPVYVENASLLKIKSDNNQFVLGSLNRSVWGKDGGGNVFNFIHIEKDRERFA